jgi:hypothetical protein
VTFGERMKSDNTKRRVIRATGIAIVATIAFITLTSYMATAYPSFIPFIPGAQASSSHSGTLFISARDGTEDNDDDIPNNITHVFITYTSIQVHEKYSSGKGAGWYTVILNGTLDLMSPVSVNKMQGSINLPSGTINIVRFDVSSAIITIHNSAGDKNYSAVVSSGRVQVTIVGRGIVIKDGETTNVQIVIKPKVTQTEDGMFKLIPLAIAHVLHTTSKTTTTSCHASTTTTTRGTSTSTTTSTNSNSKTTTTTSGSSSSSNSNNAQSNTTPSPRVQTTTTTSHPSTASSSTPKSTQSQLSILAAGALPIGLGLLTIAAAVLATIMLVRRRKTGPGVEGGQQQPPPPSQSTGQPR